MWLELQFQLSLAIKMNLTRHCLRRIAVVQVILSLNMRLSSGMMMKLSLAWSLKMNQLRILKLSPRPGLNKLSMIMVGKQRSLGANLQLRLDSSMPRRVSLKLQLMVRRVQLLSIVTNRRLIRSLILQLDLKLLLVVGLLVVGLLVVGLVLGVRLMLGLLFMI